MAKNVKLVTPLAAAFVSIFTENYANMWSRSNATGILFMYTDVTQ